MTRITTILFLAQCVGLGYGDGSIEMSSPSETMRMTFTLSESGRPTYALWLGEDPVVLSSGMGLELFADRNFRDPMAPTDSLYDNFAPNEVDGFADFSDYDSTWRPYWGEEEEIVERYNEVLIRLVQDDSRSRKMNIRFRLFDDGLGFRYEFPSQPNLIYYHVKEERTQFAMTGDHHAWWIPGDYDTQEFNYVASRMSYIRYLYDDALEENSSTTPVGAPSTQTALQLKTDDGIYINIHEAALVNYSCMHLWLDDTNMVFESHLTPDSVGVKAHLQAPNVTPWRTIIAGRSGADILASRITYNLNEPADPALKWEEWVKPTKYMGVWFEMIANDKRWDYTSDFNGSVQLGITDFESATPHGRHGAETSRVEKYIEFASQHGFDGLLVEGWNIGWEEWADLMKDYVFDFLTPYPDFDVEEIHKHAKAHNIVMIMHHETSGSTRNYERHLHRAYQFMVDHGYTSVKSGYVGNMLPYGHHHYSQDMVNHFLYCVTEAIKYKISVNAHEAVRPTGLSRTYPNLIAQESARGTEFHAFANGNHPHHTTILPFTRQIGGPMDYTPGLMNMDIYKWVDNEDPSNPSIAKANTTIANQLALYVTMYTPLQMAADTPENYARHIGRGFDFIKAVPVEWKRSVYIEAEPGSFVTIARLDKYSDSWFMGSVNAMNPRFAKFKLDFLEEDHYYRARVYYDAPTAHYWNNPHAYDIREVVVTKTSEFVQWVASGGGFAVSFEKVTRI